MNNNYENNELVKVCGVYHGYKELMLFFMYRGFYFTATKNECYVLGELGEEGFYDERPKNYKTFSNYLAVYLETLRYGYGFEEVSPEDYKNEEFMYIYNKVQTLAKNKKELLDQEVQYLKDNWDIPLPVTLDDHQEVCRISFKYKGWFFCADKYGCMGCDYEEDTSDFDFIPYNVEYNEMSYLKMWWSCDPVLPKDYENECFISLLNSTQEFFKKHKEQIDKGIKIAKEKYIDITKQIFNNGQ